MALPEEKKKPVKRSGNLAQPPQPGENFADWYNNLTLRLLRDHRINTAMYAPPDKKKADKIGPYTI